VKAELKQLLDKRQKSIIEDTSRVSSAVLIPLYKDRGIYHIVFIKRTETVKEHKGQISFPGGAREKEDKSLLDTALRESWEEIGLDTKDVEIIGEMDDEITTTSNFIVTPYIGVLSWPYHFVKNTDEVDDILCIPIPALTEKNCRRPGTEVLDGEKLESCAYHYREKVIWGATARILSKFLDIMQSVAVE
jgi:8-oxo-dGTP pyrophosphatase MutT (NUDIX family)